MNSNYQKAHGRSGVSGGSWQKPSSQMNQAQSKQFYPSNSNNNNFGSTNLISYPQSYQNTYGQPPSSQRKFTGTEQKPGYYQRYEGYPSSEASSNMGYYGYNSYEQGHLNNAGFSKDDNRPYNGMGKKGSHGEKQTGQIDQFSNYYSHFNDSSFDDPRYFGGNDGNSVYSDDTIMPEESKKSKKRKKNSNSESNETKKLPQPAIELNATNFNHWCFLRKGFKKHDDTFAEHLFEIHEKFCEQCTERIQERLSKKKKEKGKEKPQSVVQDATPTGTQEEKEQEEFTVEELEMRRLMGFTGFSTTKGTGVEDNIPGSIRKVEKDDGNSESSSKEPESTLTEAERRMMASIGGYSVFFHSNKGTNSTQGDDSEDED